MFKLHSQQFKWHIYAIIFLAIFLSSIHTNAQNTLPINLDFFEKGNLAQQSMPQVPPNTSINQLQKTLLTANLIDSMIVHRYNASETDSIPYQKHFYTYNSTDLLINKQAYYWLEDALIWEAFLFQDYTYNTIGQQTSSSTNEWDFGESKWINEESQTLYNENGNITYQLNNKQKQEFIYDNQGNLSEHIYYKSTDNQWALDLKTTYVYDNNYNVEKKTYFTFNNSSNTWTPIQKELYTYDVLEQNCQLLHFPFPNNSPPTCSIVPSSKIVQSHNGNTWLNDSKRTITFKSGLMEEILDHTWDTSKNTWTPSKKQMVSYNQSETEIFQQIDFFYNSSTVDIYWTPSMTIEIETNLNFQVKKYIASNGLGIEFLYNADGEVYGHKEYASPGSTNYPIIKSIYFSSEQVTSIGQIENISTQTIAYPNPNQGSIQLTLPSNEQVSFIQLYSLDGRLILQENEHSLHLDLTNVPTGNYLLKVQTKENIYLQQIIKL